MGRNKFENLKAWRDVIEPHPNVAKGNYKQSEFAADLAQVVRGEGSIEYTDPEEFFKRTYLTGGLKNLLSETLKRLSDGNGEPVIQLKTSFGGGKTHSLLSLYHLFGGKISQNNSQVQEVLKAANISFLPKVNTAVIVGTWENPLKSTIWGEIAAQLSTITGKPELYEMIRENDEKKVSPGVELLKNIFDAASPCLILIDEIVAYGRKLQDNKVDGGTFGNLMSFIQELTEAAKASKRTAVVVSIPQSDIEVGDDNGKDILMQVEKYFGRIELVWSPVTVEEGYEIVRHRLFKDCTDEKARKETCDAFFSMYTDNINDFPYESRQTDYRDKLMACYPIHPELFDYLYNKWTNLEKFQKTRGVLRLMANVIHELWKKGSQSVMIMPSDIPLGCSSVRDELTKYFKENWDAIVTSEVDGDKSKAAEIDSSNGRFGNLMASRKITRTIFMGTAPVGQTGGVRGIDEKEIRLGTIQPKDLKSVSIFNDALSKLKANLYYLYSQNTRCWFSTQVTLRKMVDDKKETFSDDDINFEIEEKVKIFKEKSKFKSVHTCLKKSEDIIDEQVARIIILPPSYPYDIRKENNPALVFAEEILEKRGNIPRMHKNTLMFLSAEVKKLEELKKVIREYLAWEYVLKDKSLNIDTFQREDAENNLALSKKNFDMKLSQAYSQIFAPKSDANLNNLEWQIEEITCTQGDNLDVAVKKFLQCEMLVEVLGKDKLKSLLDQYIWRESETVELNKLWEYFTTFYYMPRLNSKNVLLETIKKGVEAETFALADDEEFNGLKFGEEISLGNSAKKFLVKSEVAEKHLEKESESETSETESPNQNNPETQSTSTPETEFGAEPSESEILPTEFHMDTYLDTTRLTRDFNNCISEIYSHLATLPGSAGSVHISINISVPDGISKDAQGDVESNCQTLKVKSFHFE